MRHRQLSRFVQCDPVFAPGEQGHAEILLQMLHGTGDGGGGDVKFLRHPAEGAQVGKGGQLFQFIEIHHTAILLYVSEIEKQIAISIVYFRRKPL